MEECGDIISHVNNFNRCISHRLDVDADIEDKDQVMILLCSLSKSYDTLMTTLLIWKTILTMNEASTILLKTSNVIQSAIPSHGDVITTQEHSRVSSSSRGIN